MKRLSIVVVSLTAGAVFGAAVVLASIGRQVRDAIYESAE